jgi:hypothetical protein
MSKTVTSPWDPSDRVAYLEAALEEGDATARHIGNFQECGLTSRSTDTLFRAGSLKR